MPVLWPEFEISASKITLNNLHDLYLTNPKAEADQIDHTSLENDTPPLAHLATKPSPRFRRTSQIIVSAHLTGIPLLICVNFTDGPGLSSNETMAS